MTNEKWQEIISMVEDKFKVEEKGAKAIDDAIGGNLEFIIFEGPLDRMKLERTERPVVLDKKTTYSNRIGSGVKVDYVLSPDEKIYKFKAYKWDEGENDWVEMEAAAKAFSI
jgi:hypothetical protein